MTSQEIAWAIEAERQEMGISRFDLCRKAQITLQSFWKARTGRSGMQFYTINALVEAAGFELVIRKKEDAHEMGKDRAHGEPGGHDDHLPRNGTAGDDREPDEAREARLRQREERNL
jgi:hypothetical protein